MVIGILNGSNESYELIFVYLIIVYFNTTFTDKT